MARILIVDDSMCASRILGHIVEKGGHEVIGRAFDGELALNLCEQFHPELVTLDYLMEGKDGEAVLEEMIEHDPSIKVIMIAGSGDDTLEERALRAGARCYLDKSRVQSDLLTVIDQVMRT
jgi:DNA-binding NarL/FixJ family response regulator